MRAAIAFSAVCAVIMLCVCAVSASEADIFDSPGWEKKVHIDVKDATFAALVKGIVEPTGTKYSIDKDIEMFIVPGLSIKDVPSKTALMSLLKTCNADYKVQDGQLLIVPKEGYNNVWLTHVTINIRDTTLKRAVEALFRGTGINYIIDPSIVDRTVSLECVDVPLYVALRSLTEAAGVKYSESPEAVSIFPESALRRQPVKSSGSVRVSVEPGDGDQMARRTSVEVKDARLGEVVEKLLSAAKGLNFSIDDACSLTVDSLKLEGVTLREALEEVVRKAGAVYVYESNVIQIKAKNPPASLESPISLNMKEIPLAEALEKLFKGVGLRYVLETDVSGLRVTASLRDVPFQSVIRTLLDSVGMAYRIAGDTFHIYSTSPAPTTLKLPGEKCTEEVTLKETTAAYIMQVLGFGMDGRPVNAAQAGAGASMVPQGIESIGPGKSEDKLVVVGVRGAVDELKKAIQRLDVPPKVISIAVECYDIDPKLHADLIAIDKLKDEGHWTKAREAIKELRAKVEASGAELLTKSSFSVLNGMREAIPVQSSVPSATASGTSRAGTRRTTLAVSPTVLDDGEILIAWDLTGDSGWIWDPNTARYTAALQRLSSNTRAASGELIVAGRLSRADKMAVVFVTATIAE